MSKNERKPKAPAHLADGTKKWWRHVVATYTLEPHHVRLLTLACEAWDRGEEARARIAKDGPYLVDRWNQLKTHPAVGVETNCRIAVARLIREIDLDVELPAPPPQPPLLHRYGGK